MISNKVFQINILEEIGGWRGKVKKLNTKHLFCQSTYLVMFAVLRVEQNTLSTTGLTQLYNGQMPFCGKNQFLDDP